MSYTPSTPMIFGLGQGHCSRECHSEKPGCGLQCGEQHRGRAVSVEAGGSLVGRSRQGNRVAWTREEVEDFKRRGRFQSQEEALQMLQIGTQGKTDSCFIWDQRVRESHKRTLPSGFLEHMGSVTRDANWNSWDGGLWRG